MSPECLELGEGTTAGIRGPCNPGCGKWGRKESMCGAGWWGGEWGVSHLLRETPPPHSDRTTLSLDFPPPTHLRAAATAAGPRPPALASYCPQHPGPARPPIHKYTHTHKERAHSHTHTHTETHRPGRHGVSTSTQQARTRRGPTPRGLRLLYSAPLPFLDSPGPPPSASRLRLPSLVRMRPVCRQGPKI